MEKDATSTNWSHQFIVMWGLQGEVFIFLSQGAKNLKHLWKALEEAMEHKKDEERRGGVHSKDPQPKGSQELLGTKRCLWFCGALMGLGQVFPCFWIKFPSI